MKLNVNLTIKISSWREETSADWKFTWQMNDNGALPAVLWHPEPEQTLLRSLMGTSTSRHKSTQSHHCSLLSPPLPCIFSISILIAFTLDLLHWIEGPIRSNRTLTSLIRALRGPYQVRVSFTWGCSVCWFSRDVGHVSVSLQLLQNVGLRQVIYWVSDWRSTSKTVSWLRHSSCKLYLFIGCEVCSFHTYSVWTANMRLDISEQISHEVCLFVPNKKKISLHPSNLPKTSSSSFRAHCWGPTNTPPVKIKCFLTLHSHSLSL